MGARESGMYVQVRGLCWDDGVLRGDQLLWETGEGGASSTGPQAVNMAGAEAPCSPRGRRCCGQLHQGRP